MSNNTQDPAQTPGHLIIEQRTGYLYLRYVGTFYEEEAQRAIEQSIPLVRVEGGKINLLSDLSDAFLADRKASNIVAKYAKDNRPFIRKSAVRGLNGAKRFLFSFVMRLAGRKNIQAVDTIEEAEAWFSLPLPEEA